MDKEIAYISTASNQIKNLIEHFLADYEVIGVTLLLAALAQRGMSRGTNAFPSSLPLCSSSPPDPSSLNQM